jgi:hypothetical protein
VWRGSPLPASENLHNSGHPDGFVRRIGSIIRSPKSVKRVEHKFADILFAL